MVKRVLKKVRGGIVMATCWTLRRRMQPRSVCSTRKILCLDYQEGGSPPAAPRFGATPPRATFASSLTCLAIGRGQMRVFQEVFGPVAHLQDEVEKYANGYTESRPRARPYYSIRVPQRMGWIKV